MTSSQVYPTLPSTIDPEHMHTDATAGIVGTEWYAPSSVCRLNELVRIHGRRVQLPRAIQQKTDLPCSMLTMIPTSRRIRRLP